MVSLGVGSWKLGVDVRAASRRHFLSVGASALASALLSPTLTIAQARIATTDLGGATLLQGAGCNVIAIPGPDGALMIDGGLAANADALLAARWRGVRTVEVEGRRITYASDAEMAAALVDLERRVADEKAGARRRIVRTTASKGL